MQSPADIFFSPSFPPHSPFFLEMSIILLVKKKSVFSVLSFTSLSHHACCHQLSTQISTPHTRPNNDHTHTMKAALLCLASLCVTVVAQTPALSLHRGCRLACGTGVPHGWSGSDEGPNGCHRCLCDSGELVCLVALDGVLPPCNLPGAACGATCTLACPDEVVPHGWSGRDMGPNNCNACTCAHGVLSCTRNTCTTPTFCMAKLGCALQCGTSVAHGWSGMNEGPHECQRCICNNGDLACLQGVGEVAPVCDNTPTCEDRVCYNAQSCDQYDPDADSYFRGECSVLNHGNYLHICLDDTDDACDPNNGGTNCPACCHEHLFSFGKKKGIPSKHTK